MDNFLPLFPLQLVAFPNEDLNLHVFEPRYRQLVRECNENNMTFGIPAFIDGRVQEYGTEMKLVKIEKEYTDGKMDVRTKGVDIFITEEFFSRAPNKLYAGATIRRVTNDYEGDIITSQKIISHIEALYRAMNINKPIPDVAAFSTYDVAHHVGLSISQEYELLKIPSEKDRQMYMLEHLEQLVPMVKEMEALRKKIQMNGHFKDIIPPKI